MRRSLSFVLLITAWDGISNAADLSIDGSGTTNPSRCYWAIMNELMRQSKPNVHMTYRAVGSTTGQTEFLNSAMPESAATFGSGDIPLTASRYAELTAAGYGVVHLPVFVNAVSFFHSLPGDHPLNLTGTLLARIYSFDITNWNHEEIRAINPNLQLPENDDTTIVVARRARGSSSTATVTQFLNSVSPLFWLDSFVGSLPQWPEGESALSCFGSSGMAECISNSPYAIGYLDSSQGSNQLGLSEVSLQNIAGEYLTSTESVQRGGFDIDTNVFPAQADADFASVSAINRPGQFTWPMLSLSYIYVRKDLSWIPPDQRGALLAFFKAIFDEDYRYTCETELGFVNPSDGMKDFGLQAIGLLESNNPGTTLWTFETSSTIPIEGAGDFVFSSRRGTDDSITEPELEDALAAIDQDVLSLQEQVATMQRQMQDLFSELAQKDNELNKLRSIIYNVERSQNNVLRRFEEFDQPDWYP